MLHISFSYDISAADSQSTTHERVLSNRLIDLLESVNRHGSLSAAVQSDYDKSYRHIWNELRQWEKDIGRPLLVRGRGKPGQLTAFAKKLLLSVKSVEQKHLAQIGSLRADLIQALDQALDQEKPSVTFSGCPDRAVMLLRDSALSGPFFLDVSFNSSTAGLEDLARGRTMLAGFNFPENAGPESLAARSFSPFLKSDNIRLIRFCTRIQGLAVAHGNPLKLHSLLDVSLKKARYAQRAQGSGTRIHFEDLLRSSGMNAKDITFCSRTAKSHTEVAAMINQNEADAGLCVANVAANAGLDFIALVREVYYFACSSEFLESSVGRNLTTLLKSGPWLKNAENLTGYDFSNCGQILSPRNALQWF